MLQILRKFLKDESGATVIEYGMILGLVSVAVVAALGTLGISDQAMYTFIAAQYVSALGG